MRTALLLAASLCCAPPVFAQAIALAPVEGDEPATEPQAAVVEVETPYLTTARSRPKGPVDAAARDEQLGRWNVGGNSDADFISNRPGFHPGTRVKVDTRVIGGHLPRSAPFDRRSGKHSVVLSETSLLARTRKLGYWPFRLCFEDAARRGTHPKGGETLIRFRVQGSGRIGAVRLVRSKLDDPEIARCLAERTDEIELLPPPRRVDVEMRVQLWPGDVPIPRLDPEQEGAPELDRDAIARVVSSEPAHLEACYEAGLARDPGLWGRVQLHVVLAPDGSVRAAKQVESRFPDDEVTRCLTAEIRSLAFPPRKMRPSEFELGLKLGRMPARSVNVNR